jgi:hypothetical protein
MTSVYSGEVQEMKRKKRRQKRVQHPACCIVTLGREVVRTAAAEVAGIVGVVDEAETAALDCDGGCESPAEAFFAFFTFSLFTRTSLADEFLCVTYIELKVQEYKNLRLTRWP